MVARWLSTDGITGQLGARKVYGSIANRHMLADKVGRVSKFQQSDAEQRVQAARACEQNDVQQAKHDA